jgi:hypothetical protein
MKIRSATLNGALYYLAEDVTRVLRPLVDLANASPANAPPKTHRRTKAELQAAVRALGDMELEAVARKLRISVETARKLALVAKE